MISIVESESPFDLEPAYETHFSVSRRDCNSVEHFLQRSCADRGDSGRAGRNSLGGRTGCSRLRKKNGLLDQGDLPLESPDVPGGLPRRPIRCPQHLTSPSATSTPP